MIKHLIDGTGFGSVQDVYRTLMNQLIDSATLCTVPAGIGGGSSNAFGGWEDREKDLGV